jgi:hypothetical protein
MPGWVVKYDGPCSRCGTTLRAGATAIWDNRVQKMYCVECPTSAEALPSPVATEPTLDTGVAGASAQGRYERLHAKRETEIRDRWGRAAGLVLAVTNEPQSIRAWRTGARGEGKLAEALATVPGIIALHDRRIPGSSGNIDHVVIGPSGLFVVDAKLYRGLIRVRERGGFFRRDDRLYVGCRDCSNLVDGLERQVQAVADALDDAGVSNDVAITPVLCFVEGEWPILFPPSSYRGVRLEGTRSIKKLITSRTIFGPAYIEELARTLAGALPPHLA